MSDRGTSAVAPEDREPERDEAPEVGSDRCKALLGELFNRLFLCGYDELRVVGQLLGRLELGRSRYGHLDLTRDRRDFKREEAEEHLDAAVYRACDELAKRGES